MLNIYKKTEKSLNNPHGIIEINSFKDLNKPFLLCISAQSNHDKSIYGIIREGVQASRVYTSQELAAGFKLDKMPIDYLGIRFQSDDKYKAVDTELALEFIYPFLRNGANDIESIKKRARKINIMTYCNGTLTYQNVEKVLIDKLKKDNFSEEDIKEVLSQISVVAIGTDVSIKNLYATSCAFIDVNDTEIYTPQTMTYQKMLSDRNRKSLFGKIGGKNILYMYSGTGNHSIKEYLKDDNAVKPALCAVLCQFIENSILNEKTPQLIGISPLTIDGILKKYADERLETKLLLKELEKGLNYDNTPKYTLDEVKLRYQLDISYRELLKKQQELEIEKGMSKRKDSVLKKVLECIQKYSSKITFFQILSSSGLSTQMVNSNQIDATLKQKSDKEVRQLYENVYSKNNDRNKNL